MSLNRFGIYNPYDYISEEEEEFLQLVDENMDVWNEPAPQIPDLPCQRNSRKTRETLVSSWEDLSFPGELEDESQHLPEGKQHEIQCCDAESSMPAYLPQENTRTLVPSWDDFQTNFVDFLSVDSPMFTPYDVFVTKNVQKIPPLDDPDVPVGRYVHQDEVVAKVNPDGLAERQSKYVADVYMDFFAQPDFTFDQYDFTIESRAFWDQHVSMVCVAKIHDEWEDFPFYDLCIAWPSYWSEFCPWCNADTNGGSCWTCESNLGITKAVCRQALAANGLDARNAMHVACNYGMNLPNGIIPQDRPFNCGHVRCEQAHIDGTPAHYVPPLLDIEDLCAPVVEKHVKAKITYRFPDEFGKTWNRRIHPLVHRSFNHILKRSDDCNLQSDPHRVFHMKNEEDDDGKEEAQVPIPASTGEMLKKIDKTIVFVASDSVIDSFWTTINKMFRSNDLKQMIHATEHYERYQQYINTRKCTVNQLCIPAHVDFLSDPAWIAIQNFALGKPKALSLMEFSVVNSTQCEGNLTFVEDNPEENEAKYAHYLAEHAIDVSNYENENLSRLKQSLRWSETRVFMSTLNLYHSKMADDIEFDRCKQFIPRFVQFNATCGESEALVPDPCLLSMVSFEQFHQYNVRLFAASDIPKIKMDVISKLIGNTLQNAERHYISAWIEAGCEPLPDVPLYSFGGDIEVALNDDKIGALFVLDHDLYLMYMAQTYPIFRDKKIEKRVQTPIGRAQNAQNEDVQRYLRARAVCESLPIFFGRYALFAFLGLFCFILSQFSAVVSLWNSFLGGDLFYFYIATGSYFAMLVSYGFVALRGCAGLMKTLQITFFDLFFYMINHGFNQMYTRVVTKMDVAWCDSWDRVKQWWYNTWIVRTLRRTCEAMDAYIGFPICVPILNMVAKIFGHHWMPIFLTATLAFACIVLYRSKKDQKEVKEVLVQHSNGKNEGKFALDKIFLVCTFLMGGTALIGGSSFRETVTTLGSLAALERLLTRFTSFSKNDVVAADLLQREDAIYFEDAWKTADKIIATNKMERIKVAEIFQKTYHTCNTFVIADAEYANVTRLCRPLIPRDICEDKDSFLNLIGGRYDNMVINCNFVQNGKDAMYSIKTLRRISVKLAMPPRMFEAMLCEGWCFVTSTHMKPITFTENDSFADHFSYLDINEALKSIDGGVPPDRAKNAASLAASVSMTYGKYIALICLLILSAAITIEYILPYFMGESEDERKIVEDFRKAKEAREKGNKDEEQYHLNRMAYNAKKEIINRDPRYKQVEMNQARDCPGVYGRPDMMRDQYGRTGDDPSVLAADYAKKRTDDYDRRQDQDRDAQATLMDGSPEGTKQMTGDRPKRIIFGNTICMDEPHANLFETAYEKLATPTPLSTLGEQKQNPTTAQTVLLSKQVDTNTLKEPILLSTKICETNLTKTPTKQKMDPRPPASALASLVPKDYISYHEYNALGKSIGFSMIHDNLHHKNAFQVNFGSHMIEVPYKDVIRYKTQAELEQEGQRKHKQMAIEGVDPVQEDMKSFAYIIYDHLDRFVGSGFWYRATFQTCAHVYRGLMEHNCDQIRIVPADQIDSFRKFPFQKFTCWWITDLHDQTDWAVLKTSGNLGKHPSVAAWDPEKFYYPTIFSRQQHANKLHAACGTTAGHGHLIPTHYGCSGAPLFYRNQVIGMHWGCYKDVNCWTPFSEVRALIDKAISSYDVKADKHDAFDADGAIRWFKILQTKPIQYAQDKVINRMNFQFISEIGFMPFSATLTEHRWKDVVCSDWEKFKRTCHLDYDDDAFHVSNQSFSGVNKSIMKYDVPIKRPNLPTRLLNDALSDCLDCFATLKDSIPIRHYTEVEYEPGTSAGFTLKRFLNCKKKRDAARNVRAREYIDWMWRKAYLEDFPVLFSQAGKVELLKKKKLDNNDIRGFTIAPLEFVLFAGAMDQDLNDAMCQPSFYKNSFIKHGINFTDGGFRAFLKDLNLPVNDQFFIEGDCAKWDGALIPWLFFIAAMVRFYCWDKKGMTIDEWWQRRTFIWKNNCYTFVVLPTGQVVMKMAGEPSGTMSTTDDNCIYHCYILCVCWRLFTGTSLMSDFGKRFQGGLYSDDHLFSASGATGFQDFETRRAIYAEFGAYLNKDQDFVNQDIDGHKFLGLTFRRHTDGRILPTFDSLKALNSIGKGDKAYSPQVKLNRCVSFLYLLAFNSFFEEIRAFDAIYKFAHKIRDQCAAVQTNLPHIPTESQARSFWFGFE